MGRAPFQVVKAPREPHCSPPRRSSPTPTSDLRTAPPARLVPRASSAPPAAPPPTSPPSAPTLALVKDVLMLPVSSSETRDRHRSFQAWMFLVCNVEKSLPKSHRYYQ